MTNGINDAVSKAINENLPSAVAQELKQYIQDAEVLKASAENLRALLETNSKEREKLVAEVTELRKLNLKAGVLDERHRNLEVMSAQMQMVESEKRADMLFGLVDKLLRNPVVTKSMSGNVPVAIPASNGCSGYTSSQQVSQTETIEEK